MSRFCGDADIWTADWSSDGLSVVAKDVVGRVLLLHWMPGASS